MSTDASHKVYWVDLTISKKDRRDLKGHGSLVIWFTGLSASGKTTIARELDKRLHGLGVHTYLLDGDNVRHGLNKNLGFSREDRRENIRRIGEVAKLFMDAGVIVICAFISPYKEDRQVARELVEDSEFIEVFLNCPLDVCIQRDPKGLYRKALAGEVKGFTGIDDTYEKPENPDIIIDTDRLSVEECVDKIVESLVEKKIIAI